MYTKPQLQTLFSLSLCITEAKPNYNNYVQMTPHRERGEENKAQKPKKDETENENHSPSSHAFTTITT